MMHDEIERLRGEFLRMASEGFDRMFDPKWQGDMRTFTQSVNRAIDIGTGLAQWALEHHPSADAQAKSWIIGAKCPQCGSAVPGPNASERSARDP